MKKFASITCWLAVLLLWPASFYAQIRDKENTLNFSDKKYLAGAVPTENGKVVFNRQLDITGIAPQTAIELTRQWASGSLANDGYNGKICDIDNNAGSLIINIDGDLVFKSSAFQLDQATISFILDVKFNNNKCILTFRNIRYLYAINPNNSRRDVIMADNWIVDKEALNKVGTKMYAMNGKFRIRTVQLVDYLTETLRNGLNARNVEKNTNTITFAASAESTTNANTNATATVANTNAAESNTANANANANTSAAVAETNAAVANTANANANIAQANTSVAVANTNVSVANTANANTNAAIANTNAANAIKHYNFVKDMNGFEKISPLEIEGNAIKMISKEWMLVTAGTETDFNMLTASWGGFGELYNKPVAICFIRPDRYTFNYIDNGDTFTLSFYSEDFREVLNYCGSASGRNEDKVKGSRLTPLMLPSNKGIAFRQAKLIIECRKLVSIPITADAINQPEVKAERTKYPLHKIFIGEIVAVYKKN